MINLRNKILAERGLVKVKEHKPRAKRDHFGKFLPLPKPSAKKLKKTPMMKYLEQKYYVVIEEALTNGSLSIVAKQFGKEVDVSTISRWIKRFGLRYTPDNLPSCDGCTHGTMACNGGVCSILMQREEYDLMMVKREQLLKGDIQ